MRIHIGCELTFELPQTTPMIAALHVHSARVSDLERPDHLVTNPAVPVEGYRDNFGNWCTGLWLLRAGSPWGQMQSSATPELRTQWT